MGSIIVGQKKKQTVNLGGVTIIPNSGVNVANKDDMTAGKDAQEDARAKRLAEIMALPVDERLPLLLAEGYEDEAKKLSEELAAEHGESAGNAEDTMAEDGEGETEPEKRKVGRPKKSEE
jgi:hypothetical protein